MATLGTFTNFERLGKSGPATLNLTGNQTFPGGVFVSAGTLTINGSLTTSLLDIQKNGTFIPNSTVIGNVQNAGLVSPGGTGIVDTLTVQGNFVQTATGQLAIDVSMVDGVSDKVVVTGTATLAGTLALNPLGVLAPENQYVLIDAAGGIVGTFDTVTQTAAITQTLVIDGTTVLLQQVADFATNTGTPNQRATAVNLHAVLAQRASGNLQSAINALAAITDVATFRNALDQLHSEPYLAHYLGTWMSNSNLATSMLSCPTTNGATSIGKEGECVWARIGTSSFDQDRTTNNIGIDESAFHISGGVQAALTSSWHVGIGGRHEHVSANVDSRAKYKGDQFSLAGSVKGRWGNTMLATVLSGGIGAFDTTRSIALPGVGFSANGDQDVGHVGALVRIAHGFDVLETMYLRPSLDLSATYVNLGSVTETGAGNVGLDVASTDGVILAATSALEIGCAFKLGENVSVRPYVRGGVTLLNDNDISVSTRFQGAPAGVGSFNISSEFDDVFATAEAGLTLIGANGLTAKLSYSGQFGENTRVHGGALKIGFKF